ncbi:hypothetical protein RHGRI_037909 [Rhododendron griersonianum]|uniref:Uncharacterized protein n=1 Tax=Rhododendron griersonianum TaxID=479676 RepID=A0AAV6HXS2_9ERIC|nr:hypothetical protein RHGRI_037909 [Rhododendron griersonianum]
MMGEEVENGGVRRERFGTQKCLVNLDCFPAGKELHGFSLRMGMESDVFVANPLNDMYTESGNSTEASIVIHILNTRNVVSWNAMIADFARSSLEHAAAGLVGQISSCWAVFGSRSAGQLSSTKNYIFSASRKRAEMNRLRKLSLNS